MYLTQNQLDRNISRNFVKLWLRQSKNRVHTSGSVQNLKKWKIKDTPL